MNLPLSDWTVAPAAAVLAVAFVCRLLRSDQNPLLRLASRWTPLLLAVAIFAGMWILEARFEPIPLVFALLFGLVPAGPARPSPQDRTRLAIPLLLGAVSAAVTFWVWSGGNFAPRFHDESAYLLQAGIFAEGRWSDPSPPLPDFFEQFHVLVVPARAAKYPPGHALLLAPGVALGAPPTGPLFLVAGTAALLFALTRRFAGERAAFLAWMVWTIAPAGLRQRSSYFSELTTSFLWLAVWWVILKWRDTDRPIWLSVAAFGASWGAITRPLAMLLFAVPLATVVLVRLVKRRRIRDVPAAAIAQSLGRPPSGNVTFVTINLLEPGSRYGDRVNQLDFRVAKILTFSGKRAMLALDMYNALNANPILTYNTAFVPGGPWLQPRSFAGAGAILTGRLFRISAEFTF